MPFLSPSVVEPSSHISRKNAIMAVTKSAYAIFQAPPWATWPPFLTRLMMMGWSFFESPAMVLLLALHMALELGEARAVAGVQQLAAEFDRHLRRVALHGGEQRGLDALQFLAGVLDLLLQQPAQGFHEAVGQENAEE